MIWRVLKRVYAHPGYWLITLIVAIVTLSVMVLLPNYAVLLSVFLSPVVSVVSKVAFLGSLYGSLVTNYTILAGISVVLISGLFGVNAALLWYYIRRATGGTTARTMQTTTLGGLTAAAFGIGCAACGSAVLAFLLKLIGIAWLITYLPFHGAEFGLIGVLLLLLTTRSLAKKINDPIVCPI